jgi:hypothetical protein
MNRYAYENMCRAEREYLLDNGWTENGPDDWSKDDESRRQNLIQGHAVNVQKQRDRMYLQWEEHEPRPFVGAD